MPHEIVRSVATSPWPHSVPELCLVGCVVEMFDRSLSTRDEKIFGSVSIKEPKTRKATHHEAQHLVSLVRPGLPQRVHQTNIFSPCCRPSPCPRRARASFSLQNKTTASPATSLQPPRCNGNSRGVHSVLRSGVEQRSFAHTVWLLRALPLLLGDVERKKSARRRRTHYEQSHTGLDYGVLRIRRLPLGAACVFQIFEMTVRAQTNFFKSPLTQEIFSSGHSGECSGGVPESTPLDVFSIYFFLLRQGGAQAVSRQRWC